MTHRCYTPPPLTTGEITLDDAEAHHLAVVLRAAVGDVVELFDGQGRVANATIAAIRKRDVRVTVETVRQEPPPPHKLTIATAIVPTTAAAANGVSSPTTRSVPAPSSVRLASQA